MKTNTLPLVAFLAAIAAYAFLPMSAVAAFVALSVTGMISILAVDYGRGAEPAGIPAPAVPCDRPSLALTGCKSAA
jgi:hypothetical protein